MKEGAKRIANDQSDESMMIIGVKGVLHIDDSEYLSVLQAVHTPST